MGKWASCGREKGFLATGPFALSLFREKGQVVNVRSQPALFLFYLRPEAPVVLAPVRDVRVVELLVVLFVVFVVEDDLVVVPRCWVVDVVVVFVVLAEPDVVVPVRPVRDVLLLLAEVPDVVPVRVVPEVELLPVDAPVRLEPEVDVPVDVPVRVLVVVLVEPVRVVCEPEIVTPVRLLPVPVVPVVLRLVVVPAVVLRLLVEVRLVDVLVPVELALLLPGCVLVVGG